MKLKPTVRINGVKPEMVLGVQIIIDIFRDFGKECIITSCTDGTHSRASQHYLGAAVDLRISHLSPVDPPTIVTKLREAMGLDFDVVLENDHIHVEYQPKEAF